MQTSQFPWHWFQTNWGHVFSLGYSNRKKTKLLLNIWEKLPIGNCKTHKTRKPMFRLEFWFHRAKMLITWNLSLSAISFTIGKTHRRSAWSSNSWSSGLVWNQLPRVCIVTWLNDVITLPVNMQHVGRVFFKWSQIAQNVNLCTSYSSMVLFAARGHILP